MSYTLSQRLSHFFHVISNIRPIVWIGLYVSLTPLFALIYWALPADQFRIPEGASTDYWSWLYYSIVTITTLGFGDYTPAHLTAQWITAIEVTCGLVFLGFFLNAVGSMKSEIDIESEREKQKLLHEAAEKEKLIKSVPMLIHSLNTFLAYCYAVTTPDKNSADEEPKYNPNFTFNDLSGLFQPSGLPIDRTNLPAVERLLKSASQTSLALDSLQQRIDLTLWPQLLEICFSFVANCQIFSNTDLMFRNPEHIIFPGSNLDDKTVEQILSEKIAGWESGDLPELQTDLGPIVELYTFIKENASLAISIVEQLTQISLT